MVSYPTKDWGSETNTQKPQRHSGVSNSFWIAIGILVFLFNAVYLFIINFLAYLNLYPIAGETFEGIFILGVWVAIGVSLIFSSVGFRSDGPDTNVNYAYLTLFLLIFSVLLFGGLSLYANGGRLGYFESIEFMLIHDFPMDIGLFLIGFGTVRAVIRHNRQQLG